LDITAPDETPLSHSLELDCIMKPTLMLRDKWVVVFVNGDDNCSRTNFATIRKKLL
jgi:hypothetical protein